MGELRTPGSWGNFEHFTFVPLAPSIGGTNDVCRILTPDSDRGEFITYFFFDKNCQMIFSSSKCQLKLKNYEIFALGNLEISLPFMIKTDMLCYNFFSTSFYYKINPSYLGIKVHCIGDIQAQSAGVNLNIACVGLICFKPDFVSWKFS